MEELPNNVSVPPSTLLTETLATIEDFLRSEEWHYSSKTIGTYIYVLKKFFFFVENTKHKHTLDQLVKQDVVEYIQTLYQRHLKKATIHNQLASLKNGFVFLKMMGLLPENPIADYKLERVGGRSRTKMVHTIKALTKGQMIQVLDKIRNYKHQYSPYYLALNKKKLEARPKVTTPKNSWEFVVFRDYLMLVLMYSTGLRKDELLSLIIAQVDLDKHLLRNVKGKGNKIQNLFMLDLCEKYLYVEHRPVQKTIDDGTQITVQEPYSTLPPNYESLYTLLSLYMAGKDPQSRLFALSESGVNKRFNVWSNRIPEVPHLNPHMTRHTAGTHVGEYTGNPVFVKEFLRHENLGTTSIYVHPPETDTLTFFAEKGLYTGK